MSESDPNERWDIDMVDSPWGQGPAVCGEEWCLVFYVDDVEQWRAVFDTQSECTKHYGDVDMPPQRPLQTGDRVHLRDLVNTPAGARGSWNYGDVFHGPDVEGRAGVIAELDEQRRCLVRFDGEARYESWYDVEQLAREVRK